MQRLLKILGSRLILFAARSLIEAHDLVIETQSNSMMPVDACYIHYPSVLPTRLEETTVMRAYGALVKALSGAGGRARCSVLTNSRWTARVVEETYRVKPWVLHPPVDTEFFAKDVEPGGGRERIIATVTRITPEKRVEELLMLASRMPRWTFVIAGFCDSHDPYVGRLQRMKAEMGLDNVFLALNAPRSMVRRLLKTARYYVHPPFREHFGISIAEAMASGTPPIVYRGGGAWTDLVAPLDPRLGYRRLGEVPAILERIDRDYERLQERAIMISEKLSVKAFKERALEVIDELLARKPASSRSPAV
jgi:glycosyltransferase involved in cell wall biosynthesis